MYSASKVEEKCFRFFEKYKWRLQPHSCDEVDRFNAGLKKLEKRDSKGNGYFDDSCLTPAMYRFIQNERALAALSAEYFLTRYFWLTETDIQHFQFRSGQRAFFSVLQDLEDRGVSQDIQCLKARKQGISTLVEGLMTHASLMVPGTRCSIGSADDQKTQVMMEMMYGALNHIPWWLTPTQTKDKRSGRALLQFSHIGTMIVIQHGAMRGGIGQGTTPNKIHLCFNHKTKIRAEHGSLLAAGNFIQNSTIAGDGTLTEGGAHTSARKNEITAELTPWGYFEAQSTTLDHPVLTPNGLREAGILQKNDEVVYAVRPIRSKFMDSEVNHRPCGKTNRKWATTATHDYNLGWICGLYIAEGHIRTGIGKNGGTPRDIIFTMHENEVTRNMTGLRGVFKDETITLRRRKDSKTCQLHFYSGGWAKWMLEHFGRTEGKHIPDWVFDAGKDFGLGLLHGYLEGDGHISKTKPDIFASTIREGVAHQLRDLTASLGFGWPAMYNREGGLFYNRHCKEIWTLMWSGEMATKMRVAFGWPRKEASPALHWRYSEDKSKVYVRLKRVERGVCEHFVDIEVTHSSHIFHTAQMAVKNSEVSQYTNPEAQIEEGLFKAVPTTPDTLMVLESTGEGNTGWWAEQWRANKEKYWQGRGRLLPLFLPWFMTPELYPTRNWILKFPFPAGWRRGQTREVQAMIDKCELYVRNTEMLSRILGKKWRLPDEQVWYWQFHFEDAKQRRMEKSWSRQMPNDDFEALIGEHDSVYGQDTLNEINAKREKSTELFGIIGGGIREAHDPAPIEVDYSRPRIAIDWRTPNGIPVEWVLMPLTGNPEADKFDPLKKFIVYERPDKGARYSIGVDPGTGVGGDRTAICITRTGYGAFPDVQVAEFASDDIGNTEIFAFVACMAAWYGQLYDEGETVRIIIEQKRKYGDSCYHALKLHGFKNHHKFRMYDKKTLRERPSSNPREGWFTNEWSRPMLLDCYKNACTNGWMKVNSKWLLAEMEGHEQRVTEGGKTRADHARGRHDDRLFAASMAYFTNHDMDALMEREHKRCQAPTGEVEWEIDDGEWMGPVVSNVEAERFLELYAE